jgi:hypothetical protein
MVYVSDWYLKSLVYLFLGAFSKLQKGTISLVMSCHVTSSVRLITCPHGTSHLLPNGLSIFYIWVFFENVMKNQGSLKSGKCKGYFRQSNYTLMTESGSTYLLTPWSRVLLEKLTDLLLVKKFPASYGTRWFITAFTCARHLSLSWASPIQSIPPHTTSFRSILILSSHLHLGLPSCLFPTLPHQNHVHNSPLPHPSYMARPSHSSRFYQPHNSGWGVQIINP